MSLLVRRLRLLCLAPVPPRRDAAHGGGRAIAELLIRLAERHEITLLCLRGSSTPSADPLLLERCAGVREIAADEPRGRFGRLARRARVAVAVVRGTPAWVAGGTSQAFLTAVREVVEVWRPDVVQLEYHLMGAYLSALAGCSAPRVLRQLEPGAATARDRAGYRGGLARLAAPLDCRAWERFERGVMARVSVVVALTERDAASLGPLAGNTPIECIPLGVSPPSRAFDPAGQGGAELLFVGNFAHAPNVEALERLIRVILPGVRSRCPDAVLRAVGPDPPAHLRGREHEGVHLTGRVPDVGPYLDRAAVVLAPLRIGGGMRVKVMEALAGGKAVVATPLAVDGLDVTDGDQVRIGRTDEELVRATVELLQHPDRRVRLARRAREWAISELNWDRPAAAFDRLYQSLLPASPGKPPRVG
ncbi:MAG: glycosyltransferase [Gemmatimonadales bacterium]|nr:glycosyltransferase [Gemmatimonadales bacterium]